MNVRLRPLLTVLLAALASVALAACGGGETASSDTDAKTLLKDTFSKKEKKVDSGKFALSLRIDARGTEGVNGPVTVKLGGPFQSQGKKIPKFDVDFAFEGAGQSIKAGTTSTGTKAFVNFQGSDYVVSDQLFKQFQTGFDQAQKQGNQQNQSFSTLGLDPSTWLTNPTNAGEAKVDGDDTIKITGGVDVARLLDDINRALQKTKELGVQNTQNLPSQLTPEQKKQVADSVKDPKVEIYTGKDDTILRRIVVALNLTAPAGQQGSAGLKLDYSISGLNDEQKITAPANPKPFDQLLSSLGGLGLGGLGGAGGTGGATPGATPPPASSGSSGSGSGAAQSEALEKYSKCVTDAGSDSAKARECADLLTNP